MFSFFSSAPEQDESQKPKENQKEGATGDKMDMDVRKVMLEMVQDVAELKEKVAALEVAEPNTTRMNDNFDKKELEAEIHSLQRQMLVNRPGGPSGEQEDSAGKSVLSRLEEHDKDVEQLRRLVDDAKSKTTSLERWMYMSMTSGSNNSTRTPQVHMDDGHAVGVHDVEKDALRAGMLKLEVSIRDVRDSIPVQVDAYLKKLRKLGMDNGLAGVGPEITKPFGILSKEVVDTLREGIMEEVKLEQMKTLRSVQPLVKEALGGMKVMLPASQKGGLTATAPIKVVLPGEIDDTAQPSTAKPRR